MQGTEDGSDRCCFACCWNLCLLLAFLLAWYFLRLWRSQFQALPAWQDQPQPPPQGHKERAPEGTQDGDSPRNRRQRSIRRLLCDSPTCSLCQRVAAEAAELGYPPGQDPGQCRTRAPLVPPAGQREHFPAADLGERSAQAKWLRRARKLPTDCGLCPLTPGQLLLPAGHSLAGLPCKDRALKSLHHHFCSQGGSVSWASQEENSHGGTTSSVLEASFSSWTGGSSSTGSTGSWQGVFAQFQQLESEAVSSSAERTWEAAAQGRGLHQRRRRKEERREGGSHCSRCHRRKGKARRSSAAAGGILPTHGVGLGKEAWATLEQHLLRKQLQRALGLPSVLLHSLWAFVPPGPRPLARRPPENVVVAPRPQPLPFLKLPASRDGLEKHLEKMVFLRRWGLPQRLQDTLRHMRPGSRPCAECLPHAPKSGRLPSRRDLPSQSLRKEPGVPETANKHRDHYGVCLLGPCTKKGLGTPQVGGALPWMSAAVETLEAHVLKKRLQQQWGLPGLVRLSVRQVFPIPPRCAAGRPSTQSFLWGENSPVVTSQIPFLLQDGKELLEGHLRRWQVQRKWGLPHRVVKSLRVFLPASPPWAEKIQERGPGPRRLLAERAPSTRTPTPFKRLLGVSGEGVSRGDPNRHLLEEHLAKKGLEIQLGALPTLSVSLPGTRLLTGKPPLPKVIPPGQRVLQLRRTGLLFMDPDALSRLELSLARKRLAYEWGLPTLYTQSLARFSLGTGLASPRLCPPPTHPGRVTFAATEVRFVAQERQEQLEWHVKRKQLQHLWGLPGLVQLSLRHLLPGAPRLRPPGGRQGAVAILRSPLSCLGRATQQKLEVHIRKRVTLQRWGLPGRVLRSLKLLLLPELGHLQTPRGEGPRAWLSSHDPLDDHFQRASGTREAWPERKRKVVYLLGSKDLRRLKRHLSKRSVEVQLRAVPLLARMSRQLAQLEKCPPLPRLIRPGQGTRLPRRRLLPFLRAEDMDRIELAIFRRHLSFLWGLGPRYVGGLAGLRVPHPSTPPHRPRSVAIVFSEACTSFLDDSTREALEQHLRSKRMQHAWGVPAFLQWSLGAFVTAASPLPTGPKATVQVNVLRQDVPLLLPSAHSLLETHVQKRRWQRQWGLPGRVLRSLKSMCPKPRCLASSQAAVPRSNSLALASSSHGSPPGPWATGTLSRGAAIQRAKRRRALLPAAPPPVLLLKGTKNLEVIRLRLAKKYAEKQLGAFPALVQRSCQEASPRDHHEALPKLILAGQRPLQARRGLPPFGRKQDMQRIELTIQCRYLMSLSLLGTRCTEALGGTIPRATSVPPSQPGRPAATTSVWPEGGLPFLRAQAKEALEQHVKKKRIQHLWGVPVAVQRSLRSFVDKPPPVTSLSPKATPSVRVQRREPPFFPPAVCRRLELHLLKRERQRLWGLPVRILQSLNAFAPPRKRRESSENKVPSSDGGCQARWQRKAQGSWGAGGHLPSPEAALVSQGPQRAAAQLPGKKGPGTKHQGTSLPHP